MGNDATGRQRLMFRKGPVRHIDGGYRFDVDAAHRRVLADLISQLRDEVVGNAGDDRFRRLFPVAYTRTPTTTVSTSVLCTENYWRLGSMR